MLKISRTYEVITEESAEQGDAEERGFVFEGQPCGFRELVETIKAEGYDVGVMLEYPSNPYQEGSQAYDDWNEGYQAGQDNAPPCEDE